MPCSWAYISCSTTAAVEAAAGSVAGTVAAAAEAEAAEVEAAGPMARRVRAMAALRSRHATWIRCDMRTNLSKYQQR